MGAGTECAGGEYQPGSRTCMIMWTAQTEDGGVLQRDLLEEAEDVELQVGVYIKEHLEWLQGDKGKVVVWSKVTLDFYGPEAADVRFGQKLVQYFGRRPGDDEPTDSSLVHAF